jgi:hypothetical protein
VPKRHKHYLSAYALNLSTLVELALVVVAQLQSAQMKRLFGAFGLVVALALAQGLFVEPAYAEHKGSSKESYKSNTTREYEYDGKKHVCKDGDIQLSAPLDGHYCLVNSGGAEGGPIVYYLRIVIRFFAGTIGLVAVGWIIWCGIRIITSAGNPSTLAEWRGKLVNALVGLILFILMVGILNSLVPGKLF